MVGDRKWEKWMANFCKPFTKANVRYFDKLEVDAAWKWLEEPVPPTRGRRGSALRRKCLADRKKASPPWIVGSMAAQKLPVPAKERCFRNPARHPLVSFLRPVA